MNTYAAFFKGKEITVTAPTSYEAQQKAAAAFKARKAYDVTVILTATEAAPVIHNPAILQGA